MSVYSSDNLYEIIKNNGKPIALRELYKIVKESGELDDRDKSRNNSNQIRYQHGIRGNLQNLKRQGKVENTSKGFWGLTNWKDTGKENNNENREPANTSGAGFGNSENNKQVEEAAIN